MRKIVYKYGKEVVLTCAMCEGGPDRNATHEWRLPASRRGGAVIYLHVQLDQKCLNEMKHCLKSGCRAVHGGNIHQIVYGIRRLLRVKQVRVYRYSNFSKSAPTLLTKTAQITPSLKQIMFTRFLSSPPPHHCPSAAISLCLFTI